MSPRRTFSLMQDCVSLKWWFW